MTVADDRAHGELTINASTLHTGNARRDKHLRSRDFFDAETHQTLSFRLLGVTLEPAGLVLRGVLHIKSTELQVTAPLHVATQAGQMTLQTELDVDRAAAGVGWSRAGMIKGPARLTAKLTLVAG